MKQVKMKRKDIKYFMKRAYHYYDAYEIYQTDNGSIEVHQYIAWWAVLINILMLPVVILINGLASLKGIKKEMMDQLFQKKRKQYIVWNFHTDHKEYDEILSKIY